MGLAYHVTAESGVWKEIAKRTSFLQRVLGKVPFIEKSQHPPIIRRQTGLAIGISFIGIAGLFVVCSKYYFKALSIDAIVFSMILLVQGILLMMFSIIYLKKPEGNWGQPLTGDNSEPDP